MNFGSLYKFQKKILEKQNQKRENLGTAPGCFRPKASAYVGRRPAAGLKATGLASTRPRPRARGRHHRSQCTGRDAVTGGGPAGKAAWQRLQQHRWALRSTSGIASGGGAQWGGGPSMRGRRWVPTAAGGGHAAGRQGSEACRLADEGKGGSEKGLAAWGGGGL
jgi:hypothetical protein